MADVARLLISKIVEECDLGTALMQGVKINWFEDAQHYEVYKWLLEYHASYGKAPEVEAFSLQFPNYRLNSTPEPLTYYVDKLRETHKRAILVDGVISAHGALQEEDTRTAQEELSRTLLTLGQEVATLTDQNAVEDMVERLKGYADAQKNRGQLTGVATGFPTLDLVTSGFHPQQFIVLGGAAKNCKSLFLMKMAIAAQEQGKRVLFLSFEMSSQEQLARYDAITCGVNSMHLLHGKLNEEILDALKKGMRQRKNLAPFIISTDISATTTVSGLSAKVEQHQPDIVFVDGVYLMENEIGAEPGSTQSYTAISRNLKRMAQRINIPVVVTTQALSSKMKSGQVTMHSLGWTSAWSQDADLILGAERRETDPVVNLRVVAGRNVSPQKIQVMIDWETTSMEELESDDDY